MFSSSLLRIARSAARPAAATAATARRTLGAAAAVSIPLDSPPPSVFDKIVNITIIDPSGARRSIPAMIGQTLYAACDMNGVDLGPASVGEAQWKRRSDTWTEPLYGEAATSGFDHVLLQGDHEGVKELEPMYSKEEEMLEEYWDEDEIYPGESRLASMVEVNARMDGMVVYVPDRLCDDIP